MFKVRKWNYAEKKYDLVCKEDGEYGLYSTDMNKKINCINCHKELRFGESYTSFVYHTEHGFGYCVCPECHSKEQEIEMKFQRKKYV